MENQNPKEEYEARKRAKETERTSASRARSFRSMLTWGGTGVFIVLAVWGIVALGGGGSPEGAQTASLVDAVSSKDRIQGDVSAKVVLVEYGDYQCPACAFYEKFTSELVKEFGSKIVFVYRHFPLRNIHANADLSARTAEAVGMQGKYWEMHEMLYKNQKSWERAGNAKEIFTRYAVSLGLDTVQFERDIESNDLKAKVQGDYESGVRAGVNGTPTFFLNGKKIENPSSYQVFSALVSAALGGAAKEPAPLAP